MLKAQNEELSLKLRRSEGILSRVKEELARYRAANGKNPCIHIEEEQRLNNKLKVSLFRYGIFYISEHVCNIELLELML